MDSSLKYDIPIYNSLPPILRATIKEKINNIKKSDESSYNDLKNVDIVKIENSEPFLIKNNNNYLIYLFIIFIFIYLLKIYHFF